MKHELTTVARPLAPEDIAEGMFVAVLHEHESMMPFYFADTVHDVRHVEPVAWRTIPEKARPLKVVSVCVPFVLAERPSGKTVTLDVRKTSLAGLSEAFGTTSFARLRPKKKPRKEAEGNGVRKRKPKRRWRRLWRRDRN